jgi:hypothetical protein
MKRKYIGQKCQLFQHLFSSPRAWIVLATVRDSVLDELAFCYIYVNIIVALYVDVPFENWRIRRGVQSTAVEQAIHQNAPRALIGCPEIALAVKGYFILEELTISRARRCRFLAPKCCGHCVVEGGSITVCFNV